MSTEAIRIEERAFDNAETNLLIVFKSLYADYQSVHYEAVLTAIGAGQAACFIEMEKQMKEFGMDGVRLGAGAREFLEAFRNSIRTSLTEKIFDEKIKWFIIELGLRHARLLTLYDDEMDEIDLDLYS